MANPTGKGGKRFQKGVSGNPGGGRKKDPLIKQFQDTTYKEFVESLQLYGKMKREQVAAIAKDPETKMFDLIFVNIVAKAAQGDKDARAVLMDRLWGKPKETDLNLPHQELLSRIPIEKLIELAREAKVISSEFS